MASEPGLTNPSVITSSGLVGGIEYQNVAQAGIGNEETIVVVHRQPDDAHEMRVRLVLDQFNVARLGVEDEDGANLLIRHVQVVLGIDGDAVGLGELEQNLAAFGGGCVPARRSIHFAFLVLFPALDLRDFLGRIERLVPDARQWRADSATRCWNNR